MSSLGPAGEDEYSSKFFQTFGITEDELIRQGVDPGVYAREHIGKALKNRRTMEVILPSSYRNGILWTRWGWRGFVSMFVGVSFLALSKFPPLHWAAIGGAYLMLVIALATYLVALRYRKRYVQACREEGREPTWRQRRKP